MDAQQQQLVAELRRVQDLVRELDLRLHAPSYSADQCRRLAAEIAALTDRSILAATPPCSGVPSPLSDAGSEPFRGGGGGSPRRRRATARRSVQVRVSCAAGASEGPADDGHSWRKYGQKDILGARHPRAYYRCTHRTSRGCPATKQVQRTDGDPAVFDVVYHGDHTCRSALPGARRPPPPHQQHNPHAQGLLLGLAASLTVATTTTDALALPPMTPESCPPLGAPSPSPVASDSNNVYPCPVAWSSDGDLQDVLYAFGGAALDTEFMPTEHFSNFDYQSFDNGTIDPMPSLF
jgi:hypothetical protein